MKNLTVTKALPNFTRWEVDDFQQLEKSGIGFISVRIYSAPATAYYLEKKLTVRNGGRSDSIGYEATVGGDLADQLKVTPNAIDTPTGYDDAAAAFRSGAGAGGRKNALEAWMLTTGIAQASLAGS